MESLDNYKDVPSFEGVIKITPDGRLFNMNTGREIPQHDNGKGYLKVSFLKRSYYVHRLVMLTFVGEPEDPKMVVDHINGIRHDNRLENLRYLSNRDNTKRGGKKNCKSKLRGVASDGNRWRSTITIEGKRYFLGRFDKEIDAHNKYLEALNNWEKLKIKP